MVSALRKIAIAHAYFCYILKYLQKRQVNAWHCSWSPMPTPLQWLHRHQLTEQRTLNTCHAWVLTSTCIQSAYTRLKCHITYPPLSPQLTCLLHCQSQPDILRHPFTLLPTPSPARETKTIVSDGQISQRKTEWLHSNSFPTFSSAVCGRVWKWPLNIH